MCEIGSFLEHFSRFALGTHRCQLTLSNQNGVFVAFRVGICGFFRCAQARKKSFTSCYLNESPYIRVCKWFREHSFVHTTKRNLSLLLDGCTIARWVRVFLYTLCTKIVCSNRKKHPHMYSYVCVEFFFDFGCTSTTSHMVNLSDVLFCTGLW
jgi:hypothetical protein